MGNCAERQIQITRIPDGCRQSFRKLIRVKSPFDWLLSWNGMVAAIDTKTVQEKSLPKSCITEHQVVELLKHRFAARAGYVIWFRQEDVVNFIPASVLTELLYSKGGVKPTHGYPLGGIRDGKLDLRKIFEAPLETSPPRV